MSNRILIAGTGTGIGKTHVSIALLTALARRGHRVVGLKPIETGISSGDSDAEALARASSFAPRPPAYAFPDPVSPHLAARRAHASITLDVIRAWADQHIADWLVIETAGGLLSPLGVGLTNLDLVKVLSPRVMFLVAPDRLGVLHDVHASMLALKVLFPSCIDVGCSLQAAITPDASSGTNAAELVTLGIVTKLVSFPRAEPTDSASVAAAEKALQMFSLS